MWNCIGRGSAQCFNLIAGFRSLSEFGMSFGSNPEDISSILVDQAPTIELKAFLFRWCLLGHSQM